MTLYSKIFENAIRNPEAGLESPDVNPDADAETFQQGFDNEEDFNSLEQEADSISFSPEEIDAIMTKSLDYKENIENFIGTLELIQQDVLRGLYKDVKAKGLDKFAPIIKDLRDLGTALTAGINDKMIKKQSTDEK